MIGRISSMQSNVAMSLMTVVMLCCGLPLHPFIEKVSKDRGYERRRFNRFLLKQYPFGISFWVV